MKNLKGKSASQETFGHRPIYIRGEAATTSLKAGIWDEWLGIGSPQEVEQPLTMKTSQE